MGFLCLGFTMNLQKGELHVWCQRLDDWLTDERCLSVEELNRAGRFRFDHHRRRFMASHSCVRQVLSSYLGREPADLQFATTDRGKPELRDGLLQFNYSHTDEVLMIAIALDCPVGMDVEATKETVDLLPIARRFFATGEYEALAATGGRSQVDGFYRLWTLKEAYVKGTGEGLQAITQKFDFSRGLNGEAFDHEGWRLQPVEAPPGYLAAVASRQPMKIRQLCL